MKKNYLLSLLGFLFFVSNIHAQLSDIHYLPPLKQVSNNVAIKEQAFYLSTPEITPFNVLVYTGTNPVPVTVIGVSNATPQLYDIPDGDNDISLVTDANTGIVLSNSGLRFESVGGQEFYVNYRGRSDSQAASLTSKGRKALGTIFKWGGIPNRANNENLTTALGIMATEDNTTIDIYGYDPGSEFRLQGDPDGLTDDTMQITLSAGQTFVLEALKNETTANIDGWLGTTIRADKKIVISNGGLNTGVDSSAAARDTGIDQPVPENVLGKEYVFVRGNGNNQTEFPVIIATRNHTEIFVNGSGTPIATINTGEYFEISGSNYSSGSAGGNMYVETSEAAYAYQSLAGAAIIRTVGMNFIASVNCLLPDQVNNIPDAQNIDGLDFDGGITIIASTATPDANIIVTDDSGAVTLPASSPVTGTSDWKTFYVNGLMGDVSIVSTGPVAVGMFGTNNNAGVAGYYSGFDTVPSVELDVNVSECFPGATLMEVTGSFDSYQWFQEGTILPGETANTYTPITQGDFFVRVSKGSCTYDSAVVSVYTCTPEIVLTKTVDTTLVLEGDTVTFTITVEHLGYDPVTDLVINEVLPSEFTLVSAIPDFGSWSSPDWTIGNMYSGELHTLTVVATVNELHAETTVTNTITNTQNEVDGNTITDDPTEEVTIQHSELSLSKRDRAALDGSYDTVGEIIVYDLVVTNTGDIDVTNVTITDPNIDEGSLFPAVVANLAAGEFAVFTARHTITQDDLEADQVVNSATAQATLSNGFVISDLSDDPNDTTTTIDDPTITPLDQEGGLVLEKVALPAPDGLYDALGEVIEYQLTVTNTGNVSLDNVTITDPNADIGSISPVSIPKLEVGESAIFTALHTVVPPDFTAGNVTNTATVTGTEPVEGETITDDSDNPITATLNDPTVITIPQFARLEFTKEASLPSDGSYDTVGESIFYTLLVSSTGTVDVNNVNVVDPNADNVILQSTTGTDDGVDNVVDNLASGEVASFIASHVLTQEDLDNGQVTNSAIVGGLDPSLPIPGGITDVSDDLNDPSPNDDDATIVALASEPMLSLTKVADDNTNVIEGQIITYSYIVENTGNVTIDNVSVSDVHNGDGTLGTITLLSTTGTDDGTDVIVDVLSPGETATYQATYTITATDVANQTDVTNTATATGTPRTSSIIDPTASEAVTIAPVETICSGITIAHDLTIDVATPGVSFTWFAIDNPNITGETTSISNTTEITDTLINLSTIDQIVNYTIIAVDGVGFPFDNYTYQVTVQPVPVVATAPTETICSSDTLNHDLNTDVNLSGVTYSWIAADNPNVTGETSVASTDATIADTLLNTTAIAQTVVYTITPAATNGCDGDTYTYEVVVNPEPIVTVEPTITICSDVALAHDLNTDVSLTGSAFSWQAVDNPNVTGETTTASTATSITDVLTNESGSVQIVVYTITPTSAGNCVGDSYSYTVTIDPESFVATSPTDTICSDVALNHDLNGDVNLVGSTFSWSAAANANITGETTTVSTATSITDVLTNTSGSTQTVVYTITPTSVDGCVGDAYTYTVTLDAKPFVATAPVFTVCSDVALNHDLNGDVNVTGATFSWVAAANTNITGETTTISTASSITDVLTNTSGSVQTVVYTIIPTSPEGCVGDAYAYTVTVTPESFVATSPVDTVCSDVALNHDLNGDVNILGSTFSWSAAANANVTGETTATNTTTSITDVLTNESGSVQTVVYTIIPTSPEGCVGDAYAYTVTIDPKPFVATLPTDAICSDVALNHDLNGDVNILGATFSWSAAANANVTGETTTVSTASSITDVLTNTSGTVQTVVYTITPASAEGCVGDSYTYTVTLDSKPFVATIPTDTICSDAALTHDLNGDVNLIGATFSWVAAANANVTGATTTASTATSITDVLTNESGTVQTIVYTIIPTSPDGCIGDAYTYTVTIDPEPFVATVPTDTICSGVALTHALNSDVNVTGATFSWVASSNPNVTGETLTTSTATSITDTLINTSTTIQTVVYAIIPVSSDGCIGNVYTYTVTINPSPIVAVAPTETVCSSATLSHDLNDDVNNITGASFSWSAVDNPNVTGETTILSTTDNITDTLLNTSGSIQTIVYTIIPTSGGSCVGSVYTYEVTVNPEPVVFAIPSETICSRTPLAHNLNSDVNVTGTTFSWSATDNPSVTGETTTATTATNITDVLINTSGSVQTVVYTIIPTSPDGCIGDSYTYTITINSEPFVAVAPSDTICSTDALTHDLNADVNMSGVAFSWVAADNPAITGESLTVQSSTNITDVLINTGTTTEEVVYTITPIASDGCIGLPFEYTVTVLAQPELQMTKTVVPAIDGSYDTLGEDIVYEIRITNGTETAINALTITDDNADFISMSTLPVLGSNSSVVITATHAITQEDLDLGSITNQARVSGVDFCTNIITIDSDDPTTLALDDATVVNLDQKPSVSLLKTAAAVDDGLLDDVGEVIIYSLEVQNAGNVTVSNITISDANVDVGSIIPATISALLPGQSVVFQASYTLIQEDINRGSVVNTALVTAQQPNGTFIEDLSDDPNDLTDVDLNGDGNPDDPTVIITPQFASVAVVKSVDKATYSGIDEVLTYTIEVTNTGNISLFNIVVEDPLIDFSTTNTIAQLLPNESMSVEGTYQIAQEDIDNQQLENIAIVTAEFSNGVPAVLEDSDDPLDLTNIDIDTDGDAEDPTVSYLDTDGDMVVDIDDLDWDNDGITNEEEQNGIPSLDTDADGIIDSLDPDADGDGIFDYIEAGHGEEDADSNGALEGAVGSDGIVDRLQDTIDDGTTNYQLQDTDEDGVDDFQDIDDDDDRIITSEENPDPNNNGIPEDAQDSNGNGIPDYLEPNTSNRVRIDGVEVFTGMSPNGDGVNDVFVITNENESTESSTLEVYNRWGVQVYVSDDYGKNGDFFKGISEGRVTFSEGEALPVGTYYYVYSFTNTIGERKNSSGYLYINR